MESHWLSDDLSSLHLVLDGLMLKSRNVIWHQDRCCEFRPPRKVCSDIYPATGHTRLTPTPATYSVTKTDRQQLPVESESWKWKGDELDWDSEVKDRIKKKKHEIILLQNMRLINFVWWTQWVRRRGVCALVWWGGGAQETALGGLYSHSYPLASPSGVSSNSLIAPPC